MNKSFKVIKTTNNGLNLHLLAKTSKLKLHYSHFMDVDAGVKLSTVLRNAINFLKKNKLGICSHCGEAFFMATMCFQSTMKIVSIKHV